MRESWIGREHVRAWAKIPRGLALLAALELACALAACTANDSGQLLVDPARYEVYKCDDLAKRWKALAAREEDLRELIARASQSSGGAVVGSLAYRADYDAVLSDERLLQRTAAEKNCALPFQAEPLQSGQAQSGQIPSASLQSGQPMTGQPMAGRVQSGQPQNTVYQSDQSIR